MSQKGRPRRVAELIRQEIAKLLTKGLKDPRIGFVSIMAVRMSPDLQYANVYVSLYGDEKARTSSLIALQRSAGWIRREVGKHLRIRVTPEIRFFPDDTLDEIYHLEEVFTKIHEEQQAAPMLKLGLEAVIEELRAADSFFLTSHVNPDGDAVGSVLAMRYFLEALGKHNITCYLSDPVPKRYAHLPGAKAIQTGNIKSTPSYDLALVLDVSRRDRMGQAVDYVPAHQKTLIIDHHLEEEPEGTSGYIDATYAATGEIVAALYEAAELPMSIFAAHCIYVAQITDTGGYRFSNTSPRSHRIAAALLETGIDAAEICRDVFDVLPLPKMYLLQRVLDRLALSAEGRLAVSYVCQQDLTDVAASREDMDGLINYVRNIEGVEIAALFTEVAPDATKVSLRAAAGFNAAQFLNGYGGGGHAAAAGATIEESLEAVRRKVTPHLETFILQDSTAKIDGE